MASNMENAPVTSMDDSKNNSSYAAVLSRGKALSTDGSNNNPSLCSDVTNGNELLPNVVTMDNRNSAIFEDSSDAVTGAANPLRNTLDEQSSSSNLNSEDLSSDNKLNNVESEESTISSTTVNSYEKTSNADVNESNSSGEFSDSVEDSTGVEEMNTIEDLYPNALKWKFRSENPPLDLPKTVTVLETSYGSKVYLVGTAHFSMESQEDVSKTIKAVQPDSVMLELCHSRVNILSLDEATVLEELKSLNFQKIKATIEQNGFLQGVLYFLLLSMSAHFTKQLGMAPGGEFRRAYTEASQVPGCIVHLGDRPIHITLRRAIAKLSWWQKLHIAWHLLRSPGPITQEEVERCKQKDLLEEMMAKMTGEFPQLSQVFVTERDIYLAYSLQMAALPVPPLRSSGLPTPSCVVGVVGIGHVSGIKENWGKVQDKDIPPIMDIPEQSLTSKVIRQGIRLSFIGLGLYGAYKLFPKSLIPSKPKNLFSFYSIKLF